MNKNIIVGTAIVAVCAVIGYGAMSYATKSNDTPQKEALTGVQVADASGTTASVEPTEPQPGKITASGGFTGDVPVGGDSAVTIIEYASLTCPHCATFHETIYTPFKPDYIDTGKVRFIYRDYPLDNAALAATVIARCGGEKKYIGYIDLFMEQQEKWRSAEKPLEELKRLAKFGGLTSEKIDACLADTDLGQSILDRARVGQDVLKVTATPTVLINGKKFEGPMSLEGFKAAVDDALN